MRRFAWMLVATLLVTGVLASAAPTVGAANDAPGTRASRPSISAGGYGSCVVLASGGAKCWGLNSNGQLGIGTNTGPSTCGGLAACALTPVAVTNVARVVAMAQSTGFSCALLVTGTAKCFGTNTSGQLGTGNTTGALVPLNVSGITTAVAITAGADRKSTRLNSSHVSESRMPSSA